MDNLVFSLPEAIHDDNFVFAFYYLKLPRQIDVYKKASSLAIGQTIGTWVPVPGITDSIRKKYMGRVVNIFDVPSYELDSQDVPDLLNYIVQIAYPCENFGSDFPLLITSLLGNDASTSAQVKLLDIVFPNQFLENFSGPKYGLKGIQEYLGISNRPILLSMIKPCTGLSPEEAKSIFYNVAKGGVDIIKDDELMGNPIYSNPVDRVKAFKEVAQQVFDETGHKVKYFVNITSGLSDILENIDTLEKAGADGLMVNFSILGYSTLKYISEHTKLPILGHSAGVGIMTEGLESGMTTPLAVGKLSRLAGADITMINTPYGGYPLRNQKYIQTINNLVLPLKNIKPTMPSIGGGVHPGIVEKYINEVGKDIVLAAGGAIQGHNMGAIAGARAMRQAIDIVVNGGDFQNEYAQFEELKNAVDRWGYISI